MVATVEHNFSIEPHGIMKEKYYLSKHKLCMNRYFLVPGKHFILCID